MIDPLNSSPTHNHFRPGQTVFGRYVLNYLVGQGKNGPVWAAEDADSRMMVGIKLVETYPHPQTIEANLPALLNLTHPNIVRIHDFVQEGETYALVTEWVEGVSLAEILSQRGKRPFEVQEIEGWARGLMQALQFAESRGGVVHGDISLENLLLTKDQVLKVSEFGMGPARAGRPVQDDGSDAAGEALSTLSPQVVGSGVCRPKDDLYAAAACVYELLTGRPVFLGSNIVTQIQRKAPPPVAGRRAELGLAGAAEVPRNWEHWLAKCLEKDRVARPASAGVVLDILAGHGSASASGPAVAYAPGAYGSGSRSGSGSGSGSASGSSSGFGSASGSASASASAAPPPMPVPYRTNAIPPSAPLPEVSARPAADAAPVPASSVSPARLVQAAAPAATAQPPQPATAQTSTGTEVSPLPKRKVETVSLLKRPWVIVLLLLLLAAGTIQALVLGPNAAKLNQRDSAMAELKRGDERPEVNPGDRLVAWEDFIADHERQSFAFTSRGDDQMHEARQKSRFWRLAKEDKEEKEAVAAKLKAEEDLREQKLTLEFGHKIERLMAPEVKITTEDPAQLGGRVMEWEAVMTDYDRPDAPQNAEYKAHVQTARKELDLLQGRLTAARDRAKREAAMRTELVADYRKRFDAVEEQCRSEEIGAPAKLALWDEFLTALAPHVGAAPEMEGLQMAATRRRDEWSVLAATMTPAEPLDIMALFKNSPFAAWTEPHKRYVLFKSQEKFREQQLLKDAPDGKTGKPTHEAIVGFQKKSKLAANAELDTPTLKALSLDTLTQEEVAKAVEAQAGAPQMAGGPGPGGPDSTPGADGTPGTEAAKKADATKSAASSSSQSSGSSRKPSREPPKSIYDRPGGKGLEILHRATGKINAAEWAKHQKYLKYWEENDE